MTGPVNTPRWTRTSAREAHARKLLAAESRPCSSRSVTQEELSPEWCIVGTLLPYPYSPNGPKADYRSQKIYPVGAKLHILGGFPGDAYRTITVIGYGHHRPHPVKAHIQASYVGNWRARLIYRPAILRAIHIAQNEDDTCHRWLTETRPRSLAEYSPTDGAYAEHLTQIATPDPDRGPLPAVPSRHRQIGGELWYIASDDARLRRQPQRHG